MFLLDHFQNYWNLDLGCKHDKDEIAFRGGNVIGNLKQAHGKKGPPNRVFRHESRIRAQILANPASRNS